MNQLTHSKAFFRRWFCSQAGYNSFRRQLSLYGFKSFTSGQDKGAYFHPQFLRGKIHLAQRIERISIKTKRGRKRCSPETEPNFYTLPFLTGDTIKSSENSGQSLLQAEQNSVGSKFVVPNMNFVFDHKSLLVARNTPTALLTNSFPIERLRIQQWQHHYYGGNHFSMLNNELLHGKGTDQDLRELTRELLVGAVFRDGKPSLSCG
jgi:hypothetical protein